MYSVSSFSSQQMIVRLVLDGTDLGRNGEPPVLGVVEDGIDVEHDAAECVDAMAHDLADPVLRIADSRDRLLPLSAALRDFLWFLRHRLRPERIRGEGDGDVNPTVQDG